MTITSSHNQKLKEIRKLRMRRWRARNGRFVAEGEDLLAAADAAGWSAVERFCAARSGLAGVEVEASVLASASGLGSGTRALAVYAERWAERPLGPLCVYLHGVRDPGNVGTVLRSAQAFGASSVALGPGSADPFGAKAVRASMGSVFAVPLAQVEVIADLPGEKIALVAGAGVALAELSPSEPTPRAQMASVRGAGTPTLVPGPRTLDPGPRMLDPGPRTLDPGPRTLLIGAEREGLPDEVIAQADHIAHIPIRTHSLNAAMAATVGLYEVTRMALG
ncbi:MAG: TrmH family RNA methyltransferase [Solirubrobacteraceae bacterium]